MGRKFLDWIDSVDNRILDFASNELAMTTLGGHLLRPPDSMSGSKKEREGKFSTTQKHPSNLPLKRSVHFKVTQVEAKTCRKHDI